jgi:hypothetical protein
MMCIGCDPARLPLLATPGMGAYFIMDSDKLVLFMASMNVGIQVGAGIMAYVGILL